MVRAGQEACNNLVSYMRMIKSLIVTSDSFQDGRSSGDQQQVLSEGDEESELGSTLPHQKQRR